MGEANVLGLAVGQNLGRRLRMDVIQPYRPDTELLAIGVAGPSLRPAALHGDGHQLRPPSLLFLAAVGFLLALDLDQFPGLMLDLALAGRHETAGQTLPARPQRAALPAFLGQLLALFLAGRCLPVMPGQKLVMVNVRDKAVAGMVVGMVQNDGAVVD